MDFFDGTHITFLAITVLFLACTMWAVSKMSYKGQNRMFNLAAIMCCASLFFRFPMQNSFTKGLKMEALFESWLQVCNFNFVLLPLMLLPKLEIARQYSIFFALPSAISGIIGCSFENNNWYDAEVMSYWLYHIFAIAMPLWMLAARRLKPQKKYVLKSGLCVFGYFTVVAIILAILVNTGVFPRDIGYSFIYNTSGIAVFEWLYTLIPVPYFYLYPVFPVVVLLFYFVAWAFKKYEVVPYTEKYVPSEARLEKIQQRKNKKARKSAVTVETNKVDEKPGVVVDDTKPADMLQKTLVEDNNILEVDKSDEINMLECDREAEVDSLVEENSPTAVENTIP